MPWKTLLWSSLNGIALLGGVMLTTGAVAFSATVGVRLAQIVMGSL
jgi:hypothetical protein